EMRARRERARRHGEPVRAAPDFHDATVYRGGHVGPAALPRLEERVRLERAGEELRGRLTGRQRRAGGHQRRRAATEAELALSDEERARVDHDAERAGRLAALAQRRQHRAGIAAGQRAGPAVQVLALTLCDRLDDDSVTSRLDGDGRVTVHCRDQGGRAPEHRPLPRDEELPGRACRHAHASTSAPFPGAQVTTRATPGTSPRTWATFAASPGAHSTFTCGPASMVTNAGTPSARSAQTRCTHSTVAPRQ